MCAITPSLKTKMKFIRMIGPRLIDPNTKTGQFRDIFRFSEEKSEVECLLKARTDVIRASQFSMLAGPTRRGRGAGGQAGRFGRGRGVGLRPVENSQTVPRPPAAPADVGIGAAGTPRDSPPIPPEEDAEEEEEEEEEEDKKRQKKEEKKDDEEEQQEHEQEGVGGEGDNAASITAFTTTTILISPSTRTTEVTFPASSSSEKKSAKSVHPGRRHTLVRTRTGVGDLWDDGSSTVAAEVAAAAHAGATACLNSNSIYVSVSTTSTSAARAALGEDDDEEKGDINIGKGIGGIRIEEEKCDYGAVTGQGDEGLWK
jgi:hypothetical protein